MQARSHNLFDKPIQMYQDSKSAQEKLPIVDMFSRTPLCLAFCVLIASGCSLHPVQPEPRSPRELNTNAVHYNGQTVVVRGYVQLAPEAHVLYQSQVLSAAFRKGMESNSRDFNVKKYNKYCLTIANPGLLYKNRSTVNGKTLTFRGKFIDNYLDGHTVDLGARPLPTAIVIDEHDLKRRYPALLPLR